MKQVVKFLKLDLTIQVLLMFLIVLIFIIVVLGRTPIAGVLFSLCAILGAWQMLSAIYRYHHLKDQRHAYYLLVCTVLLGLMGMVWVDIIDELLMVVFVPTTIILAIFYCILTYDTLAYLETNEPAEIKEAHEDLLDEELLWN